MIDRHSVLTNQFTVSKSYIIETATYMPCICPLSVHLIVTSMYMIDKKPHVAHLLTTQNNTPVIDYV